MRRPPVIAAMLAVLCVTAGCATYQPLDVALVGIEPLPSSTFEQRMRIELRVLNPNDRAFEATGLSLRLDVNGQPLARAVSNAPFAVPRLGETRLELTASTSLFDLARQILALPDRHEPMAYRIEGRLHRRGLAPDLSFGRGGEIGWNPSSTKPSELR